MSQEAYENLERCARNYAKSYTQTQKNWEGSYQTSIGIIEHTADLITIKTPSQTRSAKAIYLEDNEVTLKLKAWYSREEFLCELIHAGVYTPATLGEKAAFEEVAKRDTCKLENIGKWRYALNITHCLALPKFRSLTQQTYYYLCREIAHNDNGSYSFYNTNGEYLFGAPSFTMHRHDGKRICFYKQLTHRMFVERLAEVDLYTLSEDGFFSLPGKGNAIDKYGYIEKIPPQGTIVQQNKRRFKEYITLNIELTRENSNALNPKSGFNCGRVRYVKDKGSSDFYPFNPQIDYFESISLTSLPYFDRELITATLSQYFPAQQVTPQQIFTKQFKKMGARNKTGKQVDIKTLSPHDEETKEKMLEEDESYQITLYQTKSKFNRLQQFGLSILGFTNK